mmetsp:Transcript_18164/g.51979  ORF Transcript_18164/g.51979 Transcript_18164/m.51979 type:complete len:205 (-) Transcript_18164:2176-2790(-)
MRAAAALLVTTLLMRKVAKYTAPKRPATPIPRPVPIATRKLAIPPATPEFVKAVPIPNAHAIVTYISQSTASRASCWDRIPMQTMMIAATRAHTKREATPAVNTASMATARERAGINNFRRGGAESSTSDSNVKARELFALAAMNAGPASSSRTSPACNLILPGCWCTRLPSRWTAMTAAPYCVRNRTSLTVLPTNGPFLAMTA